MTRSSNSAISTYVDQESVNLFIPPVNKLIAVGLDEARYLVPGLFLLFFGKVVPTLVPAFLEHDLYCNHSKQYDTYVPTE